MHLLKQKLDQNSDNEVDIYEYENLTKDCNAIDTLKIMIKECEDKDEVKKRKQSQSGHSPTRSHGSFN